MLCLIAELCWPKALCCPLQAVEAAVQSAVQDATAAAKEQAELEADARKAAAAQQLLRELEDQRQLLTEQVHASVEQLRATEGRLRCLRFSSRLQPKDISINQDGSGMLVGAMIQRCTREFNPGGPALSLRSTLCASIAQLSQRHSPQQSCCNLEVMSLQLRMRSRARYYSLISAIGACSALHQICCMSA